MFKKREAIGSYLRGTLMHERKAEGVDYVARTVTLPPDAAAALEKYAGLHDHFKALSFSHQRERAEAMAGAKKQETRARRIGKMVEDMQKSAAAKAIKSKV